MQYLVSQLPILGHGFVYVAIAFSVIWLGKTIADARTKDVDDDKQIDDGNLAVGIRRTGFYAAIGIALAGGLSGKSDSGLFINMSAEAVDAIVTLICLFACRAINDRVMLGHIDNDAECVKDYGDGNVGNVAVGLAEAGMYIATGLILNGSFSGDGGSYATGLISAIVFFVIGQIVLLVCSLVYEAITPFNVKDEIEKNNPAAGLALAGILIGLGLILNKSIAGPFVSWSADLSSFAVYTVYGITMLLVFRKFIDWCLLPTTTLAVEVKENKNVAALAVTDAGIFAVASIIAAVM